MDCSFRTEIVRLIASGQAFDKPCLIYSLCGLGLATTTNQIDLYDGFSTSDIQIMSLVGTQYLADFRSFPVPLFIKRGLYVDFATNADEFFVQLFEPGK